MNIKEILESKEAIQALTAQTLPINTAIKLSKLQKELNEVLEIYQERRANLFEKYGEGEDLSIPDTNREVFLKEHEALIIEELDITIQTVSVETLGDIKMSPNDITNLGWLLDE